MISLSELETRPTRDLLARLERLRWCEESLTLSDLLQEEIEPVKHLILFKSDPRWKEAYRDIKTVLASREHISQKP